MAHYKIDLDKLREIRNEIYAEKNKFDDGYTAFSNYMKSDVNDVSLLITEGIDLACQKSQKCYNLLIQWLDDYIAKVQEIERNIVATIGDIDTFQYSYNDINLTSVDSTTSSIQSAFGGLGSVGGIISGGSTTTTNEEQTVTPSPYDEMFAKMKMLQDTKPLEDNIAGIENEIEEVKRLLEETTDPAEQEKLENKLEKLYKDLSNVNYELETLLIINGLQDLLKSFKSYDEYKAYIEKIQDEITELLRTLNSDKYTSVDLLQLLINENYDPTKPIYAYIDETGIHYSLEDPILTNPNAREVEKLTFEDISKKYSDNALFQEYKQLFVDNNGTNNEAEKQAFANKVNELYDTYNEEKSGIVSELLDKTEEYDKHQRIVEYIESNAE